MQSKVHPTYKTKYRVANWPAYNQALVRRGDVTVWVSSEAIAAWTARRSGRRGGPRRYSDLAIETVLTLRLISHLPLRQAEGFLHALFGVMRLDLSVPDYTTRSRRRLRPVPHGESLHLVLDSTGLSLVGAGEWAAATHGGCGRRGWRTRHRGVDQSGVIRVHTRTEKTGDDAPTAVDRLTAVEGSLVRVTADAASDTVAVYEPATARGATVVIPPARTANVSGHGPRSPARDRTIMVVKTLGRRRWKKVSGSHRQGRVEHTCFRDTSMIGEGLRARRPAGQGSEIVLGCAILNRMTALGRPVSYRLDRGGSCRWASCGPVTIRATTPCLRTTGDARHRVGPPRGERSCARSGAGAGRDFFTTDVWTPLGRTPDDILFLIDLKTRRRAGGEDLQHSHRERPPQGRGHETLDFAPRSTEGARRGTERLGGLLKS